MPDEQEDRLKMLANELVSFSRYPASDAGKIRAKCAEIFRLGEGVGWDKHVAVVQQRERDQDEARGVTRLVNGEMRKVVWSERRDAGEMYDAEAGIWLDEKGYTAYVMTGWGSGASAPPAADKEDARCEVVRLWTRMYGDLSHR